MTQTATRPTPIELKPIARPAPPGDGPSPPPPPKPPNSPRKRFCRRRSSSSRSGGTLSGRRCQGFSFLPESFQAIVTLAVVRGSGRGNRGVGLEFYEAGAGQTRRNGGGEIDAGFAAQRFQLLVRGLDQEARVAVLQVFLATHEAALVKLRAQPA